MSDAPDELPKLPRGRIAPGSLLDTREQLRRYEEAMGLEATKRQARLRREELDAERERRKLTGKRK